MSWLIDDELQRAAQAKIDENVRRVLDHLPNHQEEDDVTAALGERLHDEYVDTDAGSVRFFYQRFKPQTQEKYAGADGGLLVTVETPRDRAIKAALFQSKLLKGGRPPRSERLRGRDAERLVKQSNDMLKVTEEAVGLFYTPWDMYVVDASRFAGDSSDPRRPLALPSRLLTLGTYLGKWLPRCTRGDVDPNVVAAVRDPRKLRHLIGMNVASRRTPRPRNILARDSLRES